MRPHLLFGIFGFASIVLFSVPIRLLWSLSQVDQRYTHLILIPVISAFFLYRERDRIFSRASFRPRPALPFLVAAFAIYALLALRSLDPTYALSLLVLAIVLVWAAGFAVCYGRHALGAARFPFLFLLLLVPVPFDLMDRIISLLQRGSSEATYVLFKLAGVPMFRDGVRFELPGIGIEVAKECSSIHSGWALFITGLLVGHLLLRSFCAKVCLSLLTLPIAVFTNAIRIVTIYFLAVHVDIGFMYGRLHHNGGILFSLISLSILLSCLTVLRKLERHRQVAAAILH